jgi:hypothetical protein
VRSVCEPMSGRLRDDEGAPQQLDPAEAALNRPVGG